MRSSHTSAHSAEARDAAVPATTGPATGAALAARYRAIRGALLVVLLVDVTLAGAKLLYGGVSGSLGMQADGLHSLLHAAAGVIGLVGVALAARPPDARHPYGYERYEPLAAMGIAAVMAVAVLQILEHAWARLRVPQPPEVTGVSFAIMVGATAVTLALALWERRRSRQLGSSLLHADAARVAADTLGSLAVVGGLVAALAGAPRVDALVSLGIAGIIAWTAWDIVRHAARVLTDATVADPDTIAAAACSVAGVQGCHQVRARGVAGQLRIDLHITVDPTLSVAAAHAIAEAVEEQVRTQVGGVAEVLVHVGAATLH
jgi:cation diffusion facilitator family transporter